jgi:hypothetical protein
MADTNLAAVEWPGERIPTVVLATSSEGRRSMLAPLVQQYYGKLYAAPSDGAVPLVDQVAYDGATLVALPGATDHADPVLTFSDACEHFAHQLESGTPDTVIAGMLERMPQIPEMRLLQPAVLLLKAGLDTPEKRARCVAALRAVGPKIDALIQRARNASRELDPTATTRALLATLLPQISL